MGNHKFRLFNMIPNTWLYKLRDMKRASKKSQRSPKTTAKRSNSQSHTPSSPSSSSSSSSSPPPTPPKPPPPPPPNNTFYLPNRASYYFPSKDRKLTNPPTTHVPADPPRKSKSKKKFSARKPTRSSPSSVPPPASDKPGPAPDPRPFDRDVYTEDDDHHRKATVAEALESETFSVTTSATDIVFDVGRPTKLPPILTKPTKRLSDRPRSDRRRRSPSRVRVRPGSPRLSRSKAGARQRKGFMESFVVVKSSSDPRRDFQESMVEMIIENNIRSSKDLEELLACYLALNSREYHAVIVQVFEQIWIHLNDPTL